MRTLDSRCIVSSELIVCAGPQDAVCPAHAVVQVLVAFLDEKLAGLTLVVDNHRHDVAHLRGSAPTRWRPKVIWLLIW